MVRKIVIFTIIVLSGCDNGPQAVESQMGVASQLSSDSDRVTITKLSEFRDGLAYDNRRGVYLISDKQTGAEFIGVSGIGISEIGSHSQMVGKVMQTNKDER